MTLPGRRCASSALLPTETPVSPDSVPRTGVPVLRACCPRCPRGLSPATVTESNVTSPLLQQTNAGVPSEPEVKTGAVQSIEPRGPRNTVAADRAGRAGQATGPWAALILVHGGPTPTQGVHSCRGHGGTGPYEALGRVVHEAELEALLVAEAPGQRMPHAVRRQGLLAAQLELRENRLRGTGTAVRATPASAITPAHVAAARRHRTRHRTLPQGASWSLGLRNPRRNELADWPQEATPDSAR